MTLLRFWSALDFLDFLEGLLLTDQSDATLRERESGVVNVVALYS